MNMKSVLLNQQSQSGIVYVIMQTCTHVTDVFLSMDMSRSLLSLCFYTVMQGWSHGQSVSAGKSANNLKV